MKLFASKRQTRGPRSASSPPETVNLQAPCAWAWWPRWWGEPDLVARVAAAAASELRLDYSGLSAPISLDVLVGLDRERYASPAEFIEKVNQDAIRRWRVISIGARQAEGDQVTVRVHFVRIRRSDIRGGKYRVDPASFIEGHPRAASGARPDVDPYQYPAAVGRRPGVLLTVSGASDAATSVGLTFVAMFNALERGRPFGGRYPYVGGPNTPQAGTITFGEIRSEPLRSGAQGAAGLLLSAGFIAALLATGLAFSKGIAAIVVSAAFLVAERVGSGWAAEWFLPAIDIGPTNRRRQALFILRALVPLITGAVLSVVALQLLG